MHYLAMVSKQNKIGANVTSQHLHRKNGNNINNNIYGFQQRVLWLVYLWGRIDANQGNATTLCLISTSWYRATVQKSYQPGESVLFSAPQYRIYAHDFVEGHVFYPVHKNHNKAYIPTPLILYPPPLLAESATVAQ